MDTGMMKQLFSTLFAIVYTTTLHASEVVAVAHPGEILPHDKTVVWTPLFQAAWDDLHRGFGVPVKIDPPNALMDRLDHFKWNVDAVMPRDHWKIWAGDATKELIDKANVEAAQMTGENKGPFQIEPRPDARIALGLLDRNLVFKKPLHRSVYAPLVFHSADGTNLRVRFFGTRLKASGGYGGVVSVLSYQAGSHALQIASDADDSAVLYLPEKPVSFIEACAKLREWRSKKPAGAFGSSQDPNLHERDDVRIPVLKLENTTDFVSLLRSGRYFGRAGDPWQLYKAEQRLKFALTEKGAKLRVEVEIGMEPFGNSPPPPPPMIPRFFHYDRPFFVFLWRDGAEWPYFGMWVGNGAPMDEFKEP